MKARALPLLAAVALLAGCDSSTNKATGARELEPVTLTLANRSEGDSQIGHWVDAVERLSGGDIRIDVRGDWLGDDVDADRLAVRDVREGTVDLANVPTKVWAGEGVESLQALDAPMLVDRLSLQEQVLKAAVADPMLDGVRSAGVEPVALLPGPLDRPVGVTRDLRAPSDWRGAVIGMAPAAVHSDAMEALGARLSGVADGTSLRGLDGGAYDIAGIDFDDYNDAARSVTVDVVLWPRVTSVVANRDAWARLDDAQREVLQDAGRAALGIRIREERGFARGGAQSLCQQGFELVRAGASGRAALRRGFEPVYAQLARDELTREALAEIRALAAELPAEPVPGCGGESGPRAPGPDAEPLVGTWHWRVTFDQIAEAPRVPGEPAELNWGRFTLVLGADGRFEMLNDRYPEPVGFGTWGVRNRDLLVMTPGGDVTQGAGELWRFHWTLFRDTLALDRLGIAPTALTVAPLRRR